MGFKKQVLTAFLILTATLSVFAQQDSIGLATIVSKTQILSTDHPFEKVYLHFDKPYYAVGDTIWFKGYLTIGPTHQLSGASHVIYVDVINSADSLVRSFKLPCQSGIAFGDITLSQKIFKKGNYHLRAYTNWMRNFGADYFFNKTITIGDAYDSSTPPKIAVTKVQKGKEELVNAKIAYNPQDGSSSAEKKVSWYIQNDDETTTKGKGLTDKNGSFSLSFPDNQLKSSEKASLVTVIDFGNKKQVINTFPLSSFFKAIDVQFFPEGGELISGMRSKVAFKAVSPNGTGVKVTGSVTDNTGNEVASFESQHNGMGVFALLPESGKTYKAIITFPDGSKSTLDLPNVLVEGISLAVGNNDPDNLTFKISTNASYFKKYQNRGFYIVAQSGGVIYYTGLAALQSLVYTGTAPKSKFPTGILQVTLFAANGEPLSERLAFIQRNDALDVSLHTDLQAYTTRQNVKMTIAAKNKAVPAVGSFSVAVVDETKVPFDEDAETTIMSSLLLTSDLRGYIEKPGYYFKNTDTKTLADLDVLMLTQGYRRFSYTDILAGKYPPVKFLPEKGVVVSGTLRTDKGVPVFKGNVSLRLPDRNLMINSVTDADGRFVFPNVPVNDSAKVVLDARSNANSNSLMIMADVPAYQPITKNAFDPNQVANIDSALSVYLANSKKQLESTHVLKEVVIKSTKIVKYEHPHYQSLIGLSPDPDQILNADRLKDCGFDVNGCIISNAFGVTHSNDHFYIKRDFDAGDQRPMKIFFNGGPIDESYLVNVRTDEIQSIEVYLKDGVSHLNDFYQCNGILSITTKSGGYSPKASASDLPVGIVQGSVVSVSPKGYYGARLFYSPKYNNDKNTSQQATDLRSTIYWNPTLVTDKTGTATFNYYNADGKGTYKAVIEGIDLDGNIGRFVLRYQVK